MGRAIATRFAEHGADVVVTGRDVASLEETAAAVRAHGRKALVAPADLLKPLEAAKPVEAAIEAFGRLDILVCNAGGAGMYVEHGTDKLLDTPLKAVEELFALNTFSPYVSCQAAAQIMKDQGKGGVIIIVTSVSAYTPGPEVHAYAASKAAVHTLAVAWSKDLATYNIRVNEIVPGAFETYNLSKRIATPEGRKIMEGNPLGRLGQPDDIAAAAVYLASDEAAFVNGAEIRVSGGNR
jgi:NAD(P)-dependent dehydrogenase (short-subunit alcohol dehydrogenase family)